MTLPTPGGDRHTWGAKLNLHLQGITDGTVPIALAGIAGALNESPVITMGDSVTSPFKYAVESSFDGTTDNTAAIQACVDELAVDGDSTGFGGMIELPPRCKVTSIALPNPCGLHFRGAMYGLNGERGTTINGTTGHDIFTFADTAAHTYGGLTIQDLNSDGGDRFLSSLVGSTYVSVEKVAVYNPVEEGFYIEGSAEEWRLNGVYIGGGNYGFRVNGTNTTPDPSRFVDKMMFVDVITNGQAINGWRWEPFTSGSCHWINPIIWTAGEHGFYCDGSFYSSIFTNVNTEGNGQTGNNTRTTGSISSASTTLTVASSTGFTAGDDLCIQGAGANGWDHYTTIASVDDATTITIDDAAVTAVSGLGVTNAIFDEFYFANDNGWGSPRDLTFIGGAIAGESAGGNLRYSINNQTGTRILAYGIGGGTVPVYDPAHRFEGIGSSVPVRQPKTTSTFIPDGMYIPAGQGVADDNTSRAWISTPPGRELGLWLADSDGDGTGTYSEIQIRKQDANRTKLFYFDGDGNLVQATGTGAIYAYGTFGHLGASAGFFGTTPVTKETGVAVSAAGIHAALVRLGLIGS